MSVLSDIRESEGDDLREVYAFFGEASSYAQAIESKLVWSALLLRIPEPLLLTEETFGGASDQQRRKAVAKLLSALRQRVNVPNSLDADIQRALDARNRLVHGFFNKHKQNTISAPGRRMMIDELRQLAQSLAEIDQSVDQVILSLTGASHPESII